MSEEQTTVQPEPEDGRFHEWGQPFQDRHAGGVFYRFCLICGAMQSRGIIAAGWLNQSDSEPSVAACWTERGNHMLNQLALQLEVQKIIQASNQAARIQPVAGRIIPN